MQPQSRYASAYANLYATLATEKVLEHVRAHGIQTSDAVLQTDWDSEFHGPQPRAAERLQGVVDAPSLTAEGASWVATRSVFARPIGPQSTSQSPPRSGSTPTCVSLARCCGCGGAGVY